MASFRDNNPLNAPGSLYVDHSCIDCGTCYHLGDGIFEEISGRSVVKQQPTSADDWSLAKAALLSCPTNSIGVQKPPPEFARTPDVLPLKISDQVYYCGYTSEKSYGASSYLLLRPEGNVLVDSPRFNKQLARKLEQLGGVKYLFLTHRDDVADHAEFAAYFGCQRIIHRKEVSSGTQEIELQLEVDDQYRWDHDLTILLTSGHTEGHCVLWFAGSYLFSGDHLFVDHQTGKLSAARNVCWHSWEKQIKSMEKLLALDIDWIMPGHGGWFKLGKERTHQQLKQLVRDMSSI
jgi:glyoxylase-like metal-dependent hydrolase (beta-lactamase superfamily II)/ferredoxin